MALFLALACTSLAGFHPPLSCVQDSVCAGEGDDFAECLVVLGDIDGDGIDDFLTSDPYREHSYREEGWIVAVSGATRKAIWSRFGGECFVTLGTNGHAVEDLDGDGTLDVAFSTGFGGRKQRESWIFSGKDGRLLRQVPWQHPPEQQVLHVGSGTYGLAQRLVLFPADSSDNLRCIFLEQHGGEQPDVVMLETIRGAALTTRRPLGRWDHSGSEFFLAAIGDVTGDCKEDVLVCVEMSFCAMYSVWSGTDLRPIWKLNEELGNVYDLEWATCGDLDADGCRDLLYGAHWSCGGPDVHGYVEARSGRTGSVLFRIARADLD